VTHPGQTCTRCIMDTSAAGIVFDDEGVCNYCTDFLNDKLHVLTIDPEERERRLEELVARVKRQGLKRRYDCIVGISGGIDSSWVLVQAVRRGLRPLAVHMDNGWNSELAQNNIANLVRGLGVDLYTHVIDWPEIRGLMEALLAADVIDVELLYDNAMLGVNYQQARKYGLHYILGGTNLSTEGVAMPSNWNWHKHDKRNIAAISRRFGGPRIKTFPAIGTLDLARFILMHRVHWVSFLNYLDYKKATALDVLTKEFGYKPYAYKHYESVFTRFYQGYILPNKFSVDKRKVHLSTLIMTGQMSREEALRSCEGIAYPNPKDLEADKQYFIKKMGWTEAKLDEYIRRPEKPHDAYPSEAALFQRLLRLYKRLNLNVGRVAWKAAS
jgi:N-acetyl sugar amidotransferase